MLVCVLTCNGLVCVYVQDLEPEVRTFNTAIIACNMCGQPQEALKVRGEGEGGKPREHLHPCRSSSTTVSSGQCFNVPRVSLQRRDTASYYCS